ncbi:expressed unknown protein [Seminavis robusta]|uniref:Peptidase S1 domain-containing protein n=1 Tax=Seminavis robusta TaxID=568900 RepID=A0A9N8EI38_9STRA|nr:expressed unknown protein [Seminavis robusta]|eukprot:Sro1135_g245110.1 n/a (521) ;mRNA; r:33412-34974
MMKFVHVLLFLAATSALVLVSGSKEHLSRYRRFLDSEQQEVHPVLAVAMKKNPNDPNEKAIVLQSVPAGQGAVKLVPENNDDRRRLLSHTHNRRRAEEVSFTRPSEETGFYFSNEIIVEIENVDPATAPSIVFSGIDNGMEYSFPVTAEDVADGVVIEILDNLVQGLYTLKLVAADGQELIVLDETVEVGSPQTPVGDEFYEEGGDVMGAVGRIYFFVDGNLFACTGTVIHDNKSGRSLVMTAAHCVWPDRTGQRKFAYDPIFIPNRDAVEIPTNETGRDIHRTCTEDVCGCWTLSGGVVHDVWSESPWPQRLAYDYGFYVVKDYGMHEGTVCRDTTALDIAVDEMQFSVGDDIVGEPGYSFGYALQWNPFFRYCSDTITVEDTTLGFDTAWINSCSLGTGSTGGPWMIDFSEDTGRGKVVTVNSWYKTWTTGYGGPFIDASEARCLVNAARDVDIDVLFSLPEGEQGIIVNCYDRPCRDGTSRMLRGGRMLCGHQDTDQAVSKHQQNRDLLVQDESVVV